ncbi:hypothetical protein J4437_07520 [Candidatus Woesearchaeota archaeon]|nr:hypothetical protein [uncultured archaeon]MBS3124447.1 hypothetical protein [Candidatus Woesearchaeota archaeon]
METKTKLIIGGLAALVVALPLTCGVALNDYNYSEGSRVGVVVKYSKKGFPGCKTYEGTLALEGQASTGATSGRTWDFSVDESSIDTQVKSALDSGKRVKLDYQQHLWTWPCRGNTEYFLTEVSELK